MTTLDEALRLHDAGYCVVPLRLDGQKYPSLQHWETLKTERPDRKTLPFWFHRSQGLGVIGGKVSGGAELLDFDDHSQAGCVFEAWWRKLAVGVARKLVIYRSPNGWRAAYRYADCYAGAKRVLARRPKPSDPTKAESIVELLACQVVVVPGGDIRVHESGRPYFYVRRHLSDVEALSEDERATLLKAACEFNAWRLPEKKNKKATRELSGDDWTAWDDFNLRAEWDDILEPHGWREVGTHGLVTIWRRPDKIRGVSATTNHRGLDLLHVFSSSTDFEADRSYSKFGAYAVLNHKGDHSAAAKELARLRYGRANAGFAYWEEKLDSYFHV